MHYLFTWTTGHAQADAIIRQAVARWESLAALSDLTVPEEWGTLSYVSSAVADLPPTWAATFYSLSHAEQVMLAFAWLHWWQQSSEEEPGFAGWLRCGPGFALNHVSLLKTLTQQSRGALGIIHNLLEIIIERAGDWDGNPVTGREVVKLLGELDIEYRYNVHDRELWPAVLRLVQGQGTDS